MLQPTGSETPPTETAAPARLRMAAREGQTVSLDPKWRAGKKLESAREQLGLTLEQVSGLTRVRREFLEALEEMNAKLLPGRAYALAYLRSYVRVLGLEESEIVEQFQREVALSREDERPQVRDPISRPRTARPWMPVAILGVVAVGFVAWQGVKESFVAPAPAPAANAAEGPRAPLAPAAPVGEVAAHGDLVIRALADAHLEVRGPDGTIYLYRTLRAGELYRPDPGPGWTLHARDGGAFELMLDGNPAGLLGEPGAPVLGRHIDSIEPLG